MTSQGKNFCFPVHGYNEVRSEISVWKILKPSLILIFSKILFMEHNAKNICRTVISGKE